MLVNDRNIKLSGKIRKERERERKKKLAWDEITFGKEKIHT